MKTPKFVKNLTPLVSGLALLAAVSCSPYQQQGAGIGALAGAGLGAVVGDDSGDVLRGAAAGAAVGAGAAAYQENQQNRSYNNTRTYTPQTQTSPQPSYQAPQERYVPPVTQPAPAANSKYPLAMSSIKPNTVISPYAPYNVIDITGYKSGDKLCDPSTIPNNPATGRPYTDASGNLDVKRGKYFIVP